MPGETGPSGGPALTDVLGACLRWSDGECVVQPETGAAVTIPLGADRVGQAGAAAAVVRGCRVEPRECQLRALALWPDLVTEPLGDWLLRDSATSTARRANSVLAFGPAGVPTPTSRSSRTTSRPVGQRVAPGSAEDACSATTAGCTEGDDADTVFLLASTARLARALPAGPPPPPRARRRREW